MHNASFNTPFLVIGSGIAGLSFALKASAYGKVTLLTKGEVSESNTRYAQGGIACVSDSTDSAALHIADTLIAGAGHCNIEAVRVMVEEAPDCISELLALGIQFSRSGQGMDLGLEGGHSRHRIIHASDYTGSEIEKTLLHAVFNHPGISVYQQHMAIDLIIHENTCLGVVALDEAKGEIKVFGAGQTLLCTGGSGQVYLHTTNPAIATGDGIAMAYRAGARMADMEFIQFHPTTLYHPEASSFLISEALRGAGAFLCDADGEPFMEKYHALASLAPRDVVCRAIVNEMKIQDTECVYLDARNINRQKLSHEFPQVYTRCLAYGVDISESLIPVVPAAHYMCGGVKTSIDGMTTVNGLYATGETACTGVHGANRLASNSLLEALVFSNRALQHIRTKGIKEPISSPDALLLYPANPEALPPVQEMEALRREINGLTWAYAGIERRRDKMQEALYQLELINEKAKDIFTHFRKTTQSIELYNVAQVALLIVQAALARKESCGLHYLAPVEALAV